MTDKDPDESEDDDEYAEEIDEIIDDLNRHAKFFGPSDTAEKCIELTLEEENQKYRKYRFAANHRLLIFLGLELRMVESDPVARSAIRTKILRFHGPQSLHLSEFIQNKHLLTLIDEFKKKGFGNDSISLALEAVLSNIDDYCIFISPFDSKDNLERNLHEMQYENRDIIFVLAAGPQTELLYHLKKIAEMDYPQYSTEINDHGNTGKVTLILRLKKK